MKKYKTEFKLESVQSFMAGEGGAKRLARRLSVPEEKIHTWVTTAACMVSTGYTPSAARTVRNKLPVLAHQYREQLLSRQIAAVFDIRSPNQVLVWRRNFDQGGAEAPRR